MSERASTKGRDDELASARLRPEPKEVRCYGCGSSWTAEDLQRERLARPALLSCCPERFTLTIDQWMARAVALENALRPLAKIADIFDHVAGNRPREGDIMSWVDLRVGERVLTVEMLRDARLALENRSSGLADATPKNPLSEGRERS